MIYCSYYTLGTPYKEVFEERLLPSLKKWNLPYDIKAIDDLGSWSANTHIKAIIIKEMLLKHKQPVIFLDADASIIREPHLFKTLETTFKHIDICFHWFDWYRFWRGQIGNPKREVLSGTMYFNYTPMTLKFLDDWIKLNETSKTWEQKNAEVIVRQYGEKLQTYPLPIQYIAIIKKNGTIPAYITEPVITHSQASRQYKK